jgi:hypothetical protein
MSHTTTLAHSGTSTEIPVTRPVGLEPRQVPAPIAAAVALVVALALAVTVALITVAVSRGVAPGAGGHRTGTPIVVPHPTPGPFGN